MASGDTREQQYLGIAANGNEQICRLKPAARPAPKL